VERVCYYVAVDMAFPAGMARRLSGTMWPLILQIFVVYSIFSLFLAGFAGLAGFWN
jgi:hypothetical protein